MIFDSFGFKGSFVFTSPLGKLYEELNLFVLATPYGNTSDLEGALEEFSTVIESQLADPDSTVPYMKLSSFDSYENLLFTSVQFLNEFLFSNFNKNQLQLGCDFFCILKNRSSLYFTQIGWPLILLHERGINIPVSSDYGFYPRKKSGNSPFLPTHLLGVHKDINFKIQQIKCSKNSKLLIVKSNECPDSLISLYPQPLDQIAKGFAESSPNQGFWIGELSWEP